MLNSSSLCHYFVRRVGHCVWFFFAVYGRTQFVYLLSIHTPSNLFIQSRGVFGCLTIIIIIIIINMSYFASPNTTAAYCVCCDCDWCVKKSCVVLCGKTQLHTGVQVYRLVCCVCARNNYLHSTHTNVYAKNCQEPQQICTLTTVTASPID